MRQGQVDIVGEIDFQISVYLALELLKYKSAKHYQLIQDYIRLIRQAERSGMRAYDKPPTFELSVTSSDYSLTWCACTIVHDAMHSKLYHDYQQQQGDTDVPADAWTGVAAEKVCLAVQLNALRQLGAPLHEIAHLAQQDGSHADIDNDGVSSWEDYYSRDW